MVHIHRTSLIAVCAFACMLAGDAGAIEYTFPPAAKVYDITQPPYSADRTGATDVSAILSKAANDIIASPCWNPGILYMPNGTYLVKNTFAWKLNSSGNGVGPHVVGQSRKGTVIKLAKGTWPGTEGKGVIQTGTGVEQNFSKGINNLTVLVDSNNAGAIGIIYVSNNTGLISDVDIISADGKGMYGIQSAGGVSGLGGNGPFIVRRTYIKGFDVGMRACGSQSEMASQITLEGQHKYGLWATCGDLIVDDLASNDTCAAFQAEATVLLTHGRLMGGSPTQYAIRNFNLSSYYYDIVTGGYKQAITSAGPNPFPKTTSFTEFTPVKPVSLFSTQTTSIHLPSKYPPEIGWEADFTKWAFPADYKTAGRTDVQALQAAIDDPTKTTLCLPHGTGFQIDQPLYIRGTISRIVGTGGTFHKSTSSGKIIFDNGTAPVVLIQRISIDNADGTSNPALPIVKQSERTLVVETSNMCDFQVAGPGETYITDITSGRNFVDNPQARVWMWQWEGAPADDSTLIVRNGMVRSVGCYHEGAGSKIFCLGGLTEMLGYWEYSGCTDKSSKYLVTIANNANVSLAGIWQLNFCNPWAGYTRLVSETRNGATKVLGNASGVGDVVCPTGGNISLFTAYDSAQVQQALQSGARTAAAAAKRSDRISVVKKPGGVEVLYRSTLPGPVTLAAYSLAGRVIAAAGEGQTSAGLHRMTIPRTAGIVVVRTRLPGGTEQSFSLAQAR